MSVSNYSQLNNVEYFDSSLDKRMYGCVLWVHYVGAIYTKLNHQLPTF